MTDAPAPYIAQIHAVLPRLLALYDDDRVSSTHGLGDRSYWGWKTSDFANATFQGAAHGLTRLACRGLLPVWIDAEAALRRSDAMVSALPSITARDGSLAEAYPNESSFCVTALALFDVLSALDILGDRASPAQRSRWLSVCEPLARFLGHADETHGFIANHIATASAALFRWHHATGDGERRARQLLDRILVAQSAEGWFPEYGGADPGYQTLCLHYLADLHHLRPDQGLAEPLGRAVDFLEHFAHPDGSFGGLYGWRGTRFLCPSGIERLAAERPAAARLATFARRSLTIDRVIPLTAFDEPNLPVMFNAWCQAAEAAQSALPEPVGALPFARRESSRVHFREAGIVVDKGARHYSIVGWRRGGVVQHFVDDACIRIDAGVALRRHDVVATSQSIAGAASLQEKGDTLEITAPFVTTRSRPPTPLQFAILRLLSTTALRWRPLNELFKRIVVRRIVTGSKSIGLINVRAIRLGEDLTVTDRISGDDSGWTLIADAGAFNAVHMASRGYWQRQDDEARR